MSKITRHILLVDDEVEFCGAISRLLGAAGFEVTIACTPDEGLKLAQTGRYDIFLLDQCSRRMRPRTLAQTL
jgi:DNA-binding response OmpR family regulator